MPLAGLNPAQHGPLSIPFRVPDPTDAAVKMCGNRIREEQGDEQTHRASMPHTPWGAPRWVVLKPAQAPHDADSPGSEGNAALDVAS